MLLFNAGTCTAAGVGCNAADVGLKAVLSPKDVQDPLQLNAHYKLDARMCS